MKFMDSDHKDFYLYIYKILKKYGKTDVYYKSLAYTLSMCETTRFHFKDIFNIKKGEININSLQAAYQTRN